MKQGPPPRAEYSPARRSEPECSNRTSVFHVKQEGPEACDSNGKVPGPPDGFHACVGLSAEPGGYARFLLRVKSPRALLCCLPWTRPCLRGVGSKRAGWVGRIVKDSDTSAAKIPAAAGPGVEELRERAGTRLCKAGNGPAVADDPSPFLYTLLYIMTTLLYISHCLPVPPGFIRCFP